MATPNQKTSDFALSKGENAERSFEQLALLNGYNITPATPQQERFEHWDFRITKDSGCNLTVEVKSKKAFPILDEKGEKTFDFVLLELLGITGKDGWLYGKANIIAFEWSNGFYLVPRTTLIQLVDSKLNRKRVDSKDKMLYKLYAREGRKDLCTAVLLNDIVATRNFSFWKL